MYYLETNVTKKIKNMIYIIIILLSCNLVLQLSLISSNTKCSNHDIDPISDKASYIMISDSVIRSLETNIIEAAMQSSQEPTVPTINSDRELSTDQITPQTDLAPMRSITVDDLNKILDYWVTMSGNYEFKGKGQIFFDASIESGLDPVYLIAHAGIESAWGGSQIANDKLNYFGIGAYDHNPYYGSYHMGESLEEGIISGAVWISENYYKQGQNSLYTMRYNNGSHEYCTSDTWVNSIYDIIITSYNLLN